MEINGAEFDRKIAGGEKFIADFFASWCPPCKRFAPIFAEANESAKRQSLPIDFVKIDVDKCPEIAERYGVRSIPTIILFDKGAAAAVHIGTFATSAEVLMFAGLQ
jgi:thioredoxin